MRRYRRLSWLGIAVLLAILVSGCGGPPTDRVARSEASTIPTTTSTTRSRTTSKFQPSQIAHLGGTLALTATAPGFQTAAIHITIDSVIDPAPDGPGSEATAPGNRNVELRVTIANVGDVTVPDLGQGDENILSIEWALDPNYANPDGVPVYQDEGLPTESCSGGAAQFTNGIAPGQSVTGCVPYYGVWDTTAVTSATALLLYAGRSNGAPGEWLIP
jgi:hypothetical protein